MSRREQESWLLRGAERLDRRAREGAKLVSALRRARRTLAGLLGELILYGSLLAWIVDHITR